MLEGYSKEIQKLLRNKKIDIGSKIEIIKNKEKFEGILMPRAGGDPNFLVLKQNDGYNIGIKYEKSIKIKKIGKVMGFRKKIQQLEFDPNKPTILILHTGGTVASRVDYRTGGVVTSFEPKELINMFPEIGNIANIRSKLLKQMWSEDMRFEHHQLIAREVAKNYKDIAGIIITHGTDTLHYTSASLTFMLENLPIPVILVGSQRSSDRPSADSAMNLICAAKFIVMTDFAGVGVCMHGSINDDYCFIYHPCKVRKMHTSRRDAFQPVNSKPYAKVWYIEDKIEFLRNDYMKKDSKRKLKLKDKFEDKVALIKFYPGFDEKILKFYEREGYKGLVVEGYGLGQLPINQIDQFTKHNKAIFENLKKLIKNGCIIVATSQTIFGRVNLNVYSTGRDMQSIGILSGEDMHPEVAYVKLKWLLGNYPKEKVKKLIKENLRGEIDKKSQIGHQFI